MMNQLLLALGPAFAAGLAIQRFLEILDPIVNGIVGEEGKKSVLGLAALLIGLGLSFGAGLRVLQPLGIANAGLLDTIITGLIISAGTDGLNSILKFLGYAKENKKAEAAAQRTTTGQEALELVENRV